MKYQLINPINRSYSTIEQILTNRGVPYNEVYHYLNTTDNDINSFTSLDREKLSAAAALLSKTISNNDKCLVIVDSDADGFTSSAILINYLHDLFPAWVETNLDYRMHDGKQHGLNDHIDWIINAKVYSLVIIPDAGSNDIEECTRLKQNGISTIILDHHICDIQNPDAIVINNQLSNYPNKDFSGAGVVWQFCRYLDSLLKINNADNYTDLMALGNCADMMSMLSIETKHLINKGFHNLKNPFFVNLSEKNAFSMNNKINHMSVAFYVAPYINAICRSGTVEEKTLTFESMLKYKAFKMLPSTKRSHVAGQQEQLVQQVMRIVTNVKNRQTKAQDMGLQTIEKMIEDQHLLDHKVLLFLLEPGQVDKNIAGLIANKIMAKYQRPTCLLTKVIDNGNISYQGSARGCDKVGINDFKNICAETGLTMYQVGHPGAFGLGILQENIPAFIEKTDQLLKDMPNQAMYYVDYIYQGNNINPNDILTIANMQDLWGKDIDEPFICIEYLKVTSDMITVYAKKNNTLKIITPQGISLIKFKATNEECYMLQNTPGYYELNIIGRAHQNEWMGNVTPQIFIQDYQIIDRGDFVF